MAWIMPVFVICSTFGSTNGIIFTQSRLIFAAARKGHFPEALSLVNIDYITPMPAIVIYVSESSQSVGAYPCSLMFSFCNGDGWVTLTPSARRASACY